MKWGQTIGPVPSFEKGGVETTDGVSVVGERSVEGVWVDKVVALAISDYGWSTKHAQSTFTIRLLKKHFDKGSTPEEVLRDLIG